MKTLPLIFIFIILGCLGISAQAPNCPKITITGPSGVTQPGDYMIFTANVLSSARLGQPGYEWTVSAGAIESGQGTPSITVRSTREMANSNVSATLKVVGFPAGCKDTASETGSIAGNPQCECGFDEFGRLSRLDVRARVDSFYIRLNNIPDAKGLIVVEMDEKDSRKRKSRDLNNIYDAILFRKYDLTRVTFAILRTQHETVTKLGVLPPGADFPDLGESPILIKGEEFGARIKTLFLKK